MRELLKKSFAPLSDHPEIPLISVFLALLSARLVFRYLAAWPLETASGFQWGIATLSGTAVGKRVLIFYQMSGVLCLSYWAAVRWLHTYWTRFEVSRDEGTALKLAAFAGLGFLVASAAGFDASFSIGIAAVTVLTGLGSVAFRKLWKTDDGLSVPEFGLAIGSAAALSMLLSGWLSALNLRPFPFIGLFAVFSTLVAAWTVRLSIGPRSRFLRATLPLSFAPLLFTSSNEVYLILNSRGIAYPGPKIIFGLFSLGLFLLCGLRWSRFARIPAAPSQNLPAWFYSILGLGVGLLYFYSPTGSMTGELFEAANPVLAIQRLSVFGEWPFLQSFNQHFLSESFFQALYVLLNGYHGSDFMIYDPLPRFISAAAGCVFAYRFFGRNLPIAIFYTLVTPVLLRGLPPYYGMALFFPLVFDRVVRRPQFWSYLIWVLSAFLLTLWRIDLGAAVIPAMAFMGLALWRIRPIQRREFHWLGQALGLCTAGFSALYFGLALATHSHPLHSLTEALGYLGSSQTFGYVDLRMGFNRFFTAHYFAFPAAVIAILAALLFPERLGLKNPGELPEEKRFEFHALVFLCSFYFFNFNRGLVRHGLVENTDVMTSSFIYFILPAAALYFFPIKKTFARTAVFAGLNAALWLAFGVIPAQDQPPLLFLDALKTKLNHPEFVPRSKNRIQRMTEGPEIKARFYQNLAEFLDQNFTKQDTFVDFSNASMLYYFTGRKTPSFFNQTTLSLHNRALQLDFVKGLSQYSAPLALMDSGFTDHFPTNGTDAIDNVPNTIRHFWLYQYLCKYYRPFAIMDGRTVWIKNGQKVTWAPPRAVLSSTISPSLPAPSRSFTRLINEALPVRRGLRYLISIDFDLDPRELTYRSLRVGPQIMNEPDFMDAKTAYYIYTPEKNGPLGPLEASHEMVSLAKNAKVEEGLYIRDFYSGQFEQYDLIQLPWYLANRENLKLPSPNRSGHAESRVSASFQVEPADRGANAILVELDLGQPSAGTRLNLEYGNQNHASGSFLFTLPPGQTGLQRFVFPLGSQYPWWSAHNQWIKISAAEGAAPVEIGTARYEFFNLAD